MKVLVIGGGGREHSICFAINKSSLLSELWCTPGNAGISKIAKIANVDHNNNRSIINFCIKKKIDLVIPGSENSLANGIINELESSGIKAFGPSKEAAQLESSKIFTKIICQEANIPTAQWASFNNYEEAFKYVKSVNYPVVIKLNGLAAGKGVTIAENEKQAHEALNLGFSGVFGIASSQILIEEYLEGVEVSLFAICDGKIAVPFGTARDHKRVFDNDKGPNTGGMGSYSPADNINNKLSNDIFKKIINPTIKIMIKKGMPFKGFLYAGLMITNKGPYLIEYNVRLGDPECQTLLTRLESDFLNLCLSGYKEKLTNNIVKFSNKSSLCVVMATEGYPGKYKNGLKISGLHDYNLRKNDYIFHAGTELKNKNEIITKGGRVLNFVSVAKDINFARKKLYKKINLVGWKGSFYRKDIGKK